jgi:hypothetical protein
MALIMCISPYFRLHRFGMAGLRTPQVELSG